MFYRGYVKTKNKAAAQKFKGVDNLLTLEQAQALPEYAGVLDDDTILIDLDDAAEAEKLMDIIEGQQINCRVYQTTRGKHFMFRNSGVEKCSTGSTLAIGLHADIKVGTKNSYEVLKFDGKERFIEWEVEGEPAQLPKWLYPVKNAPDFSTMAEGDGRNEKLFGYILNLQSAGFTKDEARETLNIINQYVLETPLPAKELETITRDEAFQKPVFFEGKAFLHDKFAKFLVSNEHILKIGGVLHVYSDGCYKQGQSAIEGVMIKYIPSLRAQHRTEVLKYLEIVAPTAQTQNNSHLISFKNGIYDLSTGKLGPFTPDVIITNQIPHNYNPAAQCAAVDTVLDKLSCRDAEVRSLLTECVGYCLYRSNDIAGGKAFILTGDKANGKSTFLECFISNILGDDNTSALDLSEIGDRFSTSTIFGKLANVGDDISDEFLQGRQVAIFKKIVTGNRVKGEDKGQPLFFFNPYVKLLFSANTIPRIRDRTGAVIRRLVIVPFNATFSRSDADYDPFIKRKLTTEAAAEHIIALAIAGLQQVLANAAFTESSTAQAELKGYEEENNPLTAFLEENPTETITNEDTSIVYRRYTVFCSENQTQPMSKIGFVRSLCKRLSLKTISTRVDNGRTKVFAEV